MALRSLVVGRLQLPARVKRWLDEHGIEYLRAPMGLLTTTDPINKAMEVNPDAHRVRLIMPRPSQNPDDRPPPYTRREGRWRDPRTDIDGKLGPLARLCRAGTPLSEVHRRYEDLVAEAPMGGSPRWRVRQHLDSQASERLAPRTRTGFGRLAERVLRASVDRGQRTFGAVQVHNAGRRLAPAHA